MFNPLEEFDDIKSLNLLKQIEELRLIRENLIKSIEENFDDRDKKVGDRVKIWDFSANQNKKDGKKISSGFSYFKNTEAIIIEDNLNIDFVYDFLSDDRLSNSTKEALTDVEKTNFILDILLKYPDGTEIYTCSSFVKRTDQYEN